MIPASQPQFIAFLLFLFLNDVLVRWIALDCLADEREIQAENASDYGGHATQVLWKATTELGCALASCSVDEIPCTYLVCQCDPP